MKRQETRQERNSTEILKVSNDLIDSASLFVVALLLGVELHANEDLQEGTATETRNLLENANRIIDRRRLQVLLQVDLRQNRWEAIAQVEVQFCVVLWIALGNVLEVVQNDHQRILDVSHVKMMK